MVTLSPRPETAEATKNGPTDFASPDTLDRTERASDDSDKTQVTRNYV
jgi:hypothetical protein